MKLRGVMKRLAHVCSMRTTIIASAIALALVTSAAGQSCGKNTETQSLRDSCGIYIKVKESKAPVVALTELNARDAAAYGFCKGYFYGFMSAVQGSVTEPDGNGHVQKFTIKDGTTFDQAIRAFLTVVNERPEYLSTDAGIVISGALMASGLATLETKPVTCAKKQVP